MQLRPRWSKVFSDLWDNKVRSVLVVLSIAVGVFAIGMIAGAYFTIDEDMSVSYASGNPANIVLRTGPFEKDLLDNIEKLAEVEHAEGRHLIQARIKSAQGEWHSFDVLAMPDEHARINLYQPLSGALYPEERQIIIEKDGLEELSVPVGTEVEIRLTDGETRTLPIVGEVLDQTTNAGDYLADPLAFVSCDSLNWLHESQDFNTLYVRVNGDQNDRAYIQQITNQITDKVEKSGVMVYHTSIQKTNEHPMTSIVQAILGILLTLGVLIMFLSCSLIANTLSALLNQHLPQIGVMKLVGARAVDVFGMYMVLILFFSLIALIISVPTGIIAANAFSQLIANELNFSLQGYRIVPFSLLLQVLIAVFVPIIAGIFPILKGARISVQRAISGVEAQAANQSKRSTERSSPLTNWMSRPLRISVRNTFRRKGRLLLTLFTLTLGGAIFIAVFNVQASLDDYIQQIGNYFLADINISFDRSYRINEVEQAALMIPQVERIEGWAGANAEILDENDHLIDNVQIQAPPSGSPLVDPILVEGRWLEPDDRSALVVNEDFKDQFPDLRVGDTLTLSINSISRDWVIVGFFKFIGTDTLLAYTNYEYLSEILNQVESASLYRMVTSEHTPEYQKAMRKIVDSYFRDLDFKVTSVDSGFSVLEAASEGLSVLVTFLLIMAVLTALVGSIGLMGTMSMNVMERTREIGVMRAVGAVDRIIIQTVIVEGILIGGLSWIMAAVVSFPISVFLSNILSETMFNTPMDLKFTPTGFVIWLIFVLVLSALASVLPALNAARLTIREVLAYE